MFHNVILLALMGLLELADRPGAGLKDSEPGQIA
jgi:hypothetical protein